MKKKGIDTIIEIIAVLPFLRHLITNGCKWEQIKGICNRLGLNDTAFRDNPSLNDYLLDKNYWRGRLTQALNLED